MTCGHLFNGIGGFALAAHWMGWENVMHCEIDKFCNRVMKHHFPHSIQHEDIRTTDFSIYCGKLDIVTGGFPCQPYSAAGKRKGKEDERHLWPEMLRAVWEIQPGWIVGENVRGLTNWNGGLVFDEVQAHLEAAGYKVLPFLLPAAGVNAPHRRDRIWFVAHAKGSNRDLSKGSKIWQKEMDSSRDGYSWASSNASLISEREQANQANTVTESRQTRPVTGSRYESDQWREFPTQSPLRIGDDEFPTGLDGITFSKWCEESIKAAGNAIVPQVAYQIFKAIEQYENL